MLNRLVGWLGFSGMWLGVYPTSKLNISNMQVASACVVFCHVAPWIIFRNVCHGILRNTNSLICSWAYLKAMPSGQRLPCLPHNGQRTISTHSLSSNFDSPVWLHTTYWARSFFKFGWGFPFLMVFELAVWSLLPHMINLWMRPAKYVRKHHEHFKRTQQW